MICERCTADFIPPLNRPSWPKCPICTGGGAHARRARFGPAPAYALEPASATRVTFVVPGPPLSINRCHGLGFGKNGRRVMYFTREGRAYKSSVALHALQAIGLVAWRRDRRYRLSLMAYFDNARSDSDNPLKVVKDALQGVLFDNDVQVISDHTEKSIDKVAPRLVVTVEAVDG